MSSQFLQESCKILDDLNVKIKSSLKEHNLKLKKKIVSEKSKMLKQICEDHNLNFDDEFDKYITNKYRKKIKKDKLNIDSNENTADQIKSENKEKILSKIVINKREYWKEDNSEIIYDSKNFKKIGSYKNNKLELIPT